MRGSQAKGHPGEMGRGFEPSRDPEANGQENMEARRKIGLVLVVRLGWESARVGGWGCGPGGRGAVPGPAPRVAPTGPDKYPSLLAS